MTTETHIYGVKAKGKQELISHLAGRKLTRSQAILGKCYDCVCGYADGKRDCGIKDCTLYPFMPYKDIKKRH